MTVTTTPQDLEKWLRATTLSIKKQNAFMKRFESEGKWTPKLAEDFAEIIMTSMKAYEEDLVEFTSEMDKRTTEIQAVNKKMRIHYKESKKNLATTNNDHGIQGIMKQV